MGSRRGFCPSSLWASTTAQLWRVSEPHTWSQASLDKWDSVFCPPAVYPLPALLSFPLSLPPSPGRLPLG